MATPAACRLLSLAIVACALLCAGCSSRFARAARGNDEFEGVNSAWVRPDGGLVLDVDAALGTYAMHRILIDVPAADLEEAQATAGRFELDRAYVHDYDEKALVGLERIVTGRVGRRFRWSEENVSVLRPPGGVPQAVVYGPPAYGLIFAHVTPERASVLELQRGDEKGAWYYWPMAVATVPVDVVFGVVVVVVSLGALTWPETLGDVGAAVSPGTPR